MHTNKKLNNKILTAGSAALLLAISAPSVIAQEVNSAIEKRKQEQNVEVIEVSGVRASLENALNVKREASSIVDAISATDIDALPALDFGEALQAIPGIQLDRSGEGRQSEISLRGLSGGFIKTTAMGQSFATPSRSFGPTGGNNPFAAFEAGIFDGVTVVKSPTAEVQAGGMAGVVDKKLQQALSKQDGKFQVSAGGRYEELTGNWDKTIKFSGVKHLIEDELAVAIKFSGSEQTFRRDLVQTAVHIPLTGGGNFAGGNVGGAVNQNKANQPISNTILDYIDKYNIPDGAKLRAVNNIRNVSEYSEGDRVSFAGNIEWKPIEDLKLGAHILYTERDLGAGTKEDAQFDAGLHRNNSNHARDASIEPDMDTAPFIYKTDEDGVDHYMISNVHVNNGHYGFTNRHTTFLETSQGLFLYGDYVKDDWVMDAQVNFSKSENQFMNNGIEMVHSQHHNATTGHTPADGEKANYPSVATGINGQISTGQGNMADIIGQFTGWENYTYDNLNWNTPSIYSSTITAYDDANDGRRVQFRVNGRVDNPVREMEGAEFNAERYTELGFGDAFTISSVKFGTRYSNETLENSDFRFGIPGVDLANISGDLVKDTLLTAEQTAFFNGNVPNTFGQGSGWQTFNNAEAAATLQRNLADLSVRSEDNPYPINMIPPTGFNEYIRNNTKLNQFALNNFDVEQEIVAAYVMANFFGELSDDVSYTGNIGVRYEATTNDFLGVRTDPIAEGSSELVLSDFEYQTDYNNALPSLNLSVELFEDFVVRTAYFKALVRPNLRSQRPNLSVNEGFNNISVSMPASDLKPYTADNYDISFEWYNREGSAISVGLFQKEITDLFLKEKVCPSLGDYPFLDEQFGAFEGSGEDCSQVAEFTNPETGEVVNRDLSLTRSYNADNEIKLTGVELAVQQKLDFLPYPWNGFGGVFNYTYIDQTGSEGDNKLYKVSPESYNLIGYWENDGISLRLAYNWRDSFDIQSSNTYFGIENKQTKASGRLDFSGSYAVNKDLKVYLKAYNITDEQVYEYFGDDERAMARIDYTGRIAELSVSYTF